MVEPRHAVPFTDAIFAADFSNFGRGTGEGREERGGGRDGLDAPIEGGGVDALDGRGEGGEVRGELVRLCDAVAGEGWVAGYACGGGDGGAVFAGFGVDHPVGSELGNGLVCILWSSANVLGVLEMWGVELTPWRVTYIVSSGMV